MRVVRTEESANSVDTEDKCSDVTPSLTHSLSLSHSLSLTRFDSL